MIEKAVYKMCIQFVDILVKVRKHNGHVKRLKAYIDSLEEKEVTLYTFCTTVLVHHADKIRKSDLTFLEDMDSKNPDLFPSLSITPVEAKKFMTTLPPNKKKAVWKCLKNIADICVVIDLSGPQIKSMENIAMRVLQRNVDELKSKPFDMATGIQLVMKTLTEEKDVEQELVRMREGMTDDRQMEMMQKLGMGEQLEKMKKKINENLELQDLQAREEAKKKKEQLLLEIEESNKNNLETLQNDLDLGVITQDAFDIARSKLTSSSDHDAEIKKLDDIIQNGPSDDDMNDSGEMPDINELLTMIPDNLRSHLGDLTSVINSDQLQQISSLFSNK